MAAFALTIAIFGIWTLVGWALVCFLHGGRNLIRNALLAPIAGVAAIMLAIFECNRWGLPVRMCGPVVTLLCGGMAVAAIWRLRLPVPWRRLAPFLVALAAGAVLVGYPFFLHGLDWISYGNDDMANYVLGAKAFLDRGYLNSFDPRLILESRDISVAQWLPIILTGGRFGSELTLAWVMSLTSLTGHQVFMPVIVALHLALICATGALLIRGRNYRFAALVTCGWMTVSSLLTLGAIYQLISQVFGMGLLAGAAALLCEPIRAESRRLRVRRALLGAIFCAAIGVAYPEILPFLVLAFCLAHMLALIRHQETIGILLRRVTIVAAATILIWNTFVDSVPSFLRHQAGTGLQTAPLSDMLFPYYLVPSGMATFWGFLPIAQAMRRPLLDFAIASAAILLMLALLASLRQAWRGQPAAQIAVVMFTLAAWLAWKRSDFGLYKLAMYVQPFVLGSLVLAWIGQRKSSGDSRKWRRAGSVLAITILAGLGLRAQVHYVRLSAGLGDAKGGFIEIPDASSRRLITRLQSLSRNPRRQLVVSDTSNVVLAKLEAARFAPTRQEYPAQDFFTTPGWTAMRLAAWFPDLVRAGYVAQSRQTLLTWHEMQRQETFDMHGGPSNPFTAPPPRSPGEENYSLLASGPTISVLNRRDLLDMANESLVTMIDSEHVRNHLIHVNSELGKNYYHPSRARGEGRVALFQLEPDYFYPDRSMAAAGRVILFEVLHPSPGLRLQMEYTASLQSDGRNAIPPAQAIGAARSTFGAKGRGSARLFSSVVEPQTIAGRQYVAIDMNVEGRLFPQRREGAMSWFGQAIPLDPRRITGFIRDVSAIGAQQYDTLQAPERVADFPRDLEPKSLEYSGIYEDGWVAEESFLYLQQPAQGVPLSVRVMTPALGQPSASLRVLVDDKLVAHSMLRSGENEVRVILKGPPDRRRIDLRFNGAVSLPAPDSRMVSAQIKFVGFPGERENDIADPPIAIGENWYPFEKFGDDTFRWVDNDARVTLSVPEEQSGELAIEFEPGPGMAGRPVSLSLILPSRATYKVPSVSGRKVIRVPLKLKAGPNYLALQADGGGATIATDPRKLNFRVFRMGWLPR